MHQIPEHRLGPFTTFTAGAMYQQIVAPVRPSKKSSKRALSRAIANRDAR